MNKIDTIEFRIFMPNLDEMDASQRNSAVDGAGMLQARSEIIANGELLNANCVGTDHINWNDLVLSSKMDGEFYLAICTCGNDECRVEAPCQIKHESGFVHCFIEWSQILKGSRRYCWSQDAYVNAVANVLRAAEEVLTTRPAIKEDIEWGDVLPDDLMTNIGHAFFTLRRFNACKQQFKSLWSPPQVKEQL
ncbi:MAG: hypothetical protein WC637_03590 [Victivallales bacterium]|jgi:hypothetical protein